MSRFFVSNENISDETLKITGGDVKHIKNVLRKLPGDSLTVCDEDGTIYVAKITGFSEQAVNCDIVEKCAGETEPRVPVILLQGVPKGDKPELIIQKTVELGVSEIWPVVTERTIVRFGNEQDKIKKTERWQKISAEAAKQCGRGIIPEVAKVLDFKEAVEKTKSDEYEGFLKLIPYENEKENTLKNELRKETPKGIIIFIGPEGGFSQKEVDACIALGFRAVTLGKRILRTETAGLATVAAIRYEMGD